MTTKPTSAAPDLSARAAALDYNGGLTGAVRVSVLGETSAWYKDVVGFKLMYRLKGMGGFGRASPVSRIQVGLSKVENPKVHGVTLTWGVNDIESARKTLEADDVRFDGPTQEIPEMVKLATFYDPDGNTYMLYESLSDEQPG